MSSALVLFSGGQDSTVCLAWSLRRYKHVETVGFDYGQRHRIELECRAVLRARLVTALPELAPALGADHTIALPALGAISDTALTRERPVVPREDGLPDTFVPARNLIFLSLAAALARNRDLQRLVAGVGEADYSGYPDCRDATIRSMEETLGKGLDRAMPIDTPLMHRDKAETWALGHRIGGSALTELIVEHTHTCYLGDRTSRAAWGHGCGRCPACALRADGWRRWQAGRSGSP